MITEEQRKVLQEAACRARKNAYAPYSKTRVGAAVLASSGVVYSGVNVENASYGLTICAERAAIFQAAAAGERRLLAVAVCTENQMTPCGACRQVMREFATDLVVLIGDETGNGWETRLSALFPDAFGPEHLAPDQAGDHD